MRALYGAICTYKRPADLVVMLDSLESQTRSLDHLIVVDNDADPATAALIDIHPLSDRVDIDLVSAHGNQGPAGAFAQACQHLDGTAAPDDLVVLFDDDDPPPSQTLLADLYDFAEQELRDDTVAGVGLRGGALNPTTGMIAPRPATNSTADAETADHLHGNWFPCYRLSALRSIGFDPALFWGFEELDLGRRLTEQGYALRVAGNLYKSVAPVGQMPTHAHRVSRGLHEPSWRHFYRHRNLIRILRRDRAWGGLAVTILVRLLAKPVLYGFRQPRRAWWHLRTNLTAIREGLRREVPPPKHPAHQPS